MINRREILKLVGSSALAAYIFGAGVCCGPEVPEAPPARNDYRMAMVVLNPPSSTCHQFEATVDMAKRIAEEFPTQFSDATAGKVTVSILPQIFSLDWDRTKSTEDASVLVQTAREFYEQYQGDDLDFLTFISGFDDTAGGGHVNIFNTSTRIDNHPFPRHSDVIGSSRLIGINSLGTILWSNIACNPSGQTLTKSAISLFNHELLHQWGAFLPGFVIEERASHYHYNGKLTDLIDVLNAGWYIPLEENADGRDIFWENLGNDRFELHRPDIPSQDYKTKLIEKNPASQLTRWAMGAMDIGELTEQYLLVDYNFQNSSGSCHLPPNGTIATGRMVTAQDIVEKYLESRK